MSLGIIVCGVGGRMGGAVVRALRQSGDCRLAAAVDRPGSARVGKDAGEIAAAGRLGIAVTDDLDGALGPNSVIIDFTNPEASLGFIRSAARSRAPIVVATTGFDAEQMAAIRRLARRTPILLSANTSLGINVLVSLLGKAAKMLGDDYDVEIVEAHHRFKKDAPSGTALALGRAVAGALGRDLDQVALSGRKGIVGEHTVIFGGIGERLEFIHRAHSRETFARGALRAARWLAKIKPGLYGMEDVLGL